MRRLMKILKKLVAKFKNDGVIKKGFKDKILSDQYVVFSHSQIKSATANSGEFGQDNDIRFRYSELPVESNTITLTKGQR